MRVDSTFRNLKGISVICGEITHMMYHNENTDQLDFFQFDRAKGIYYNKNELMEI